MLQSRYGLGGGADDSKIVDDFVGAEVVDIPGQLYKRYQDDKFYTKMGPRVILSMNSDASHMKSMESASKTYASAAKAYDLEPLEPHVFNVSASAYLHMLKEETDQAIILL
jgi:myosin heavy subunit